MERLADHFVVVGSHGSVEKDDDSAGVDDRDIDVSVLQCFPPDSEHEPNLPAGLEMFCQPSGWRLSSSYKPPTFFTSVLTNMEGRRTVFASLTFVERAAPAKLFRPKALCFIASHGFVGLLKGCLCLLYNQYIDPSPRISLEEILGKMMAFSPTSLSTSWAELRLGLGERFRIRVAEESGVMALPPDSAVVDLFSYLGIHNVVTLYVALIVESRILFHSRSYVRLLSCSQALLSLLYPLEYNYPYIPILPAKLVDVLDAPTPFVMGCHTSYMPSQHDLIQKEIVVVDLDGGTVFVPGSVLTPAFPDRYATPFFSDLSEIISPGLLTADLAFASDATEKEMPSFEKDALIRAVFLYFFADLLRGYQSFLAVLRIHPKPAVHFSKDQFLSRRGLSENNFMSQLMNSLAFSSFIDKRGRPFRHCDLYDEINASVDLDFFAEHSGDRFERILALGRRMLERDGREDVALPSRREEKPAKPFPNLSWDRIREFVGENARENKAEEKANQRDLSDVPLVDLFATTTTTTTTPPTTPPKGDAESSVVSRDKAHLQNCVIALFKNGVAEAKKYLPGVCRALKSPSLRRSFVHKLAWGLDKYSGNMTSEQFDVLAQLVNAALKHDSLSESCDVAGTVLPLSSVFCRVFTSGVCQFLYTAIQDHAVWESLSFWRAQFRSAVQNELFLVYKNFPRGGPKAPPRQRSSSIVGLSSEGIKNVRDRPSNVDVLRLVADRIKQWSTFSDEEKTDWTTREEEAIYGQCILFASRMIWLLTPLAAELEMHDGGGGGGGGGRNDVIVRESAQYWKPDHVQNFVLQFFNEILGEANMPQWRVVQLQEIVSGLTDMQKENVQIIAEEISRMSRPLTKTKSTRPVMLEGESVVTDGMKAYLLPDGREQNLEFSGQALPALGALYVTTYRVVFCGLPIDEEEVPVVACLPVSSIIQFKKLAPVYLSSKGKGWLQHVYQIRSATFELMKVAFDDADVTPGAVDLFSSFIHQLRSPSTVTSTFAFAGADPAGDDQWKRIAVVPSDSVEEKVRSLKRRVRRLGQRRGQRKGALKAYMDTFGRGAIRERAGSPTGSSISEMTIDDLCRLGLGFVSETSWRVTETNEDYGVCESYPSILSVPDSVTDSQLNLIAGHFRRHRFPCAVWRHPRTAAVLLRSGSIVPSNFFAKLRAAAGGGGGGSGDSTRRDLWDGALPLVGFYNQDVRRYLTAIVTATPPPRKKAGSSDEVDGLFTASSSSSAAPSDDGRPLKSRSPDRGDVIEEETSTDEEDRGPLKLSFLQKSDVKPSSSVVSAATTVDEPLPLFATASSSLRKHGASNPKEAPSYERSSLYVIGERQKLKVVKGDPLPGVKFISVDVPSCADIRQSHRKLLRACAPSDGNADHSGFLSRLQDTGWLSHVRTLLQLAGAVVDLLDVQMASVLVGLEDGWDLTTQIVSLAQILLDPYYRTTNGFRTLLEKEWLAFGHRFSERNKQTTASTPNDFCPIFLLFLDAVYQILIQFPLSFEFNVFFLETIAYHQSSMRFATFLFDSEKERCNEGQIHRQGAEGKAKKKQGKSLWRHIEMLQSISPIFHNWRYVPDGNTSVLRPYSNYADLTFWPYYLHHDLSVLISPFDYASVASKPATPTIRRRGKLSWSFSSSTSSSSAKRTFVHEKSNQMLMDELGSLLKRCSSLQAALQQHPQPWKTIWNELKISAKSRLPLTDVADGARMPSSSSFPSFLAAHGVTMHKRTSVEVLLKGRLSGTAERVFTHPHRFFLHTYVTPTHCNYCQQVLWGIVKQGYQCADCGYDCHVKCRPMVPQKCNEFADFDIEDEKEPDDTDAPTTGSAPSKSVFYSNQEESKNSSQHEGFVYMKQSEWALRKKWKCWWFVFDLETGELRYYDALRESQCRGKINIFDASAVFEVAPDESLDSEGYCFDVYLPKRKYSFMTKSAISREIWMRKLNLSVEANK